MRASKRLKMKGNETVKSMKEKGVEVKKKRENFKTKGLAGNRRLQQARLGAIMQQNQVFLDIA